MAPETLDSLDAESLKSLVLQLLARLDELLAQNRALLARVAELDLHALTAELGTYRPPAFRQLPGHDDRWRAPCVLGDDATLPSHQLVRQATSAPLTVQCEQPWGHPADVNGAIRADALLRPTILYHAREFLPPSYLRSLPAE